MPTNLPERSKALWAKAIAERDPERKLQLLREFYSSFPKHKSTEKLEVAIKKQISLLEEKIERAKRKKVGSSQPLWSIKKEKVQIVALGMMDILSEFSKAYLGKSFTQYEILERPCISTIDSMGVTIQVVLIPYNRLMSESKQRNFLSTIRNADGVLLLGDSETVKEIVGWLEENNIHPSSRESYVSIELSSSGGLRIISKKEIERDAKEMLLGYGIKNAIVFIGKEATLDDLEAAIFDKAFKRCFCFREELTENLSLEYIESSSKDIIVESILKSLGYIRVFTKDPSNGIAQKPVLMKEGSTTHELAKEIHKELANDFAYARVWRKDEYKGEKVGKDFRLMDMDVVEIRTRTSGLSSF
jgi:ribosome-interacting GTPase 1